MFIINANVFAIEKSTRVRFMTTTGISGAIIPKAYLLSSKDGSVYETLENKTIEKHITDVATLTRSGSTVTVTMPADTPHHYVVGLSQTISNATNPEYNVTAPVTSVISKLSYTYKINTTPPTPDGGANIKSTAVFASLTVKPKTTKTYTSNNSYYIHKVPNLVTGEILVFESAIAGVEATATVQ